MGTTASQKLIIRPYTPDDVNFIIKSWLTSTRFDLQITDLKASLDIIRYESLMRPSVQNVMARCGVLVACDPEDYSHIFGFICGEHQEHSFVVHMVYVKQFARKNHVATVLLNRANKYKKPVVSSWTSSIINKIEKEIGRKLCVYDHKMLEIMWGAKFEPIARLVTEGAKE